MSYENNTHATGRSSKLHFAYSKLKAKQADDDNNKPYTEMKHDVQHKTSPFDASDVCIVLLFFFFGEAILSRYSELRMYVGLIAFHVCQ